MTVFAQGENSVIILTGLRVMFFALVFTTCLAPESRAADYKGYYIMLGVGSESCGAYLDARKAGFAAGYAAFVTGYLTAINERVPNTDNILGTGDINGALHWVDNYCQSNPTVNFAAAVSALEDFLFPSRLKAAPST